MKKTDYLGNGVAAHRGNMSLFPENTMEAFQSAADMGCSWLELDIQLSLDGQIVVTHDASALRTCGVNCVISEITFEELKKLNFGAFIQDGKFYKLPLLSEVFELVKATNIRVTIQPKCNGAVIPAIKLAEEFGVINKIAFNELNCEYLIEAKRVNPAIPVFWDRLPGTDIENDIFIAKQFGFECMMYVLDGLQQKTITEVKNAGIECGVCVVNEDEEMDKFLNWGVRMFYTDYPQKLLQKI